MNLELIKELSNANGISGFEDEVVDVIRKYTENYLDIKEDSLRNLYLYRKKNDGNKPIVMIDGHSDEVGFMVQSIKANGTIKFIASGGWVSQNIPAHRVRIKNSEGKYIIGVVATKPPHFMTESEKNKTLDILDMVIDIGATSRKEVLEDFKIEIGAPIIPDVEFRHNDINDTIIGKAFDNRLGCGLVIEVLKELQNEELDVNVVGTISTQEEVGMRGAVITANTVKPDVAIVFEGTPADDTFRDEFEAQSVLKKGPQIRHRDRLMISNPRFTKFAREIAKNLNIDFQDAVRLGGATNGSKIHLSNAGVPTIVIGVPVRYIHTHEGISAIKDYDDAIRWVIEIIKALNKEIIYKF
ncbi:M42 family metallopeptidase [Paramaledivibacter caminithermalis]|jgi:putative aminopeptidase FrvX|uniref:Putative aminopeptidase FrvX n=1 Tax=Paramaledivibacter caminithermalis (strain DSM 15212 / CIP 107654 / DViRD3) TaxID=1121301 RepID=A0A1M6KQU0_PARC5|nr:M42 family metallopeptidase [Paramaledivibacter caminithermalis]SHJ61353.1 Putative aminopeptidase FrvX [Paramaledivibacter caminithermalis DSM 15212]